MAVTFIVIGILSYYLAPAAFMYKNLSLMFLLLNIVLLLFICGATILFSFFITGF